MANDDEQSGSIPFRERFGCTIREACEATGLKPTKLYELISVGAIETVKIHKRRIVVVKSLERLIERNAVSEAER